MFPASAGVCRVQAADLKQNLAWIPKDRKIVTVSNHAGRAGKVFNVVGRVGVQNYEQEGGKLTKIAPKAPAGQQKNAQAATQH